MSPWWITRDMQNTFNFFLQTKKTLLKKNKPSCYPTPRLENIAHIAAVHLSWWTDGGAANCEVLSLDITHTARSERLSSSCFTEVHRGTAWAAERESILGEGPALSRAAREGEGTVISQAWGRQYIPAELMHLISRGTVYIVHVTDIIQWCNFNWQLN